MDILYVVSAAHAAAPARKRSCPADGNAGVVELVDTGDLKSPGFNQAVPVQVRSPAKRGTSFLGGPLFFKKDGLASTNRLEGLNFLDNLFFPLLCMK